MNTPNKKLQNTIICYSYEQSARKGYTYKGKFLIATLDVTNDVFEEFDEINKEDADYHYSRMIKEYEEFKTFLKYCD